MAFLYLGTSQASNEFTPSSSDVGKSLRHWVSPSVGSSAYAKFKPFSSLASDFESAELTDSVVRVHLVGPTHACPGQVITLTAVVENDYLGIESYEFRRNGNYLTTGVDPLYPNRISVTVPDLGGLDSLIQEYDVVITKGCHTFRSPAFYLRVNSIHVQLNDALVCSNSENGMLCADVFSNHAEAPYAYVWYNAETGAVEDTTYVPCKSFSVGKYLVEPHFTWNACVTTSDTAEVKVSNGPADDHITMDDITALSCSGSQVSAHLHGIINADSLGTPNISWSLNGITIPGAHDSLLLFSPIALAGDTTIYILKAEVSYSGFACKTYTKTDTVNFVAQPEISIYGNPIACGDNKADVELYAIANGYIENPSYTWKINGTTVTYTGTLKDTLKLANVTAPDLTASSTPYEITVSVSGENGCSASSAPFALNLNGAPVVHLSSSADTVCNGATVTLTANLADNNIPNLTYEWWYKVGTATTYTKDNTATSAQYTATVADSTSYKVVVKQTDSECQAADSMSVYVFPATPAVKPLVVSLGDTAICNGDQITLSLIDTANTNQYGVTGTYQWLVNGVEVEDAQGSSISISPSTVASDSTVFAITVNATYATTCATMVASKDTSIVLYKQPTVVISGDPIVCNDDTVRLTANIHGLYGTDKYTWRVDGVDSIMNKDFVAQLNQRDYPYNITVVVAPGTACETVSEVYSVLIGNNPTVAIGLSAATVCKDNEVTLTAHLGDYNMPNLTYQWFYKTKTMTDSVAIPTGTSRELTTVVTDTTQYFVTVTQVNSGCTAKGDTTVNVFETAPDAKPTQLLVDQANVCYGAQVTLTAIDTANYKLFGTGSYQWIVNGVTVANATDSIYTFAPATVDNDSINYTVKVRVDYASACAGMFSEKDTLITVHRNPSVVIAGDAIVCDGSALNLTAVVHDTLAGGNIDYLWRVDGVDSTTGANFTATLEQRDYPYELTVVLNKGTACEVVSAPFNVLIGNKATAAVEASDTIVCAGSNVTLTAHLGDYNMPNMTYLWYSKPASAAQFDSIPVGTSLSLTTAVAEETQYFVKITQVNSECVAYSDTIKVKVFEDAAAVKPLVLHASDTAVCYGGQIAYAVIDTANINIFGKGTYQWSVNGVTVPTATDSVFIFSPVAVDNDSTLYNVAVTVTYNTPCDVITASIDTIANVFSNLSVVISGDPILCQDSTVNLVATVHDTLAGHNVTYLWRVDGVDSVNQNSNTFSAVLPQRDYPYEITVVVGQEGTACGVVSDVYEVLIGINPTVAIEISAPIVCKGEEATLTAHLGDYNMPNLVYQWYYGKPDYSDTNAIAIGTGRILTVPVEDTTRYYVRVKQVNSECEAWADTVINVFPEDPAVKPIELVASDSTVCIGGQIAYTVQDTANRRQYFGSDTIPGNYTWFVNGFQLMTVSGDHFMFSPAAFDLDSTNYIIEVSASYQTECNLMTATAADTVTAYRNPSVVINGDPMICDTTTVHLYAIVNDTLAGLNVEYLWRVDGVDSTSMTTSEFVTDLPARDYPYEITVMINQGTNCEVVSEPFYLYIEDQPQVVITFDYDTVCIGQEVTATAHLGNYNQGNLTYQWFIDGDTVARGTESTFTYTIDKPAGSHTVFSVIVNQLNSACMGTGTDSVYTFANPTLDTVLVTNLQDDIYDAFQHHSYYGQPAYDVCEGASIQITAYMKDASGNRYIDTNVTYKWRRNGVVIEGVNGYTFMEQLAILDHDQYKYVYTVEIDEPQYPNCYSVPTSVVSDTVKVRRNPIVIIGGQHYVCYQGPSVNNIVLQAWVDGSVDTGAIYRWYRDGQLEDNPYHSMYGAMFTGPFAPRYGFNYVFQVEVVNGSGCSSFSEPFEVTVMAPPVVNITPYTDTVCRGGEVMLVSHLDDYNVLDYELKYQWYANEISTENLIPGATEPFYNTNVDSTTDFIVDVRYLTENVNRPHCFARDTMTVNVYDRPEIDSIIMSLTEVCEGSQVQLTAVMDSVHQGVPNVPYIYEWYRNSELLPGNAATIYDAPMTVDGNEQQYTYSVKVYQNPERMMCESPIFVSSQTLTVFPNPIVAIFGDQHVCYTDTITLVANIDTISNPVSTNVHYYWFESGAPIDNLNGDSAVLSYYAPAQDEPYRFTVQVERDSSITGCRSYSYEYDVWVYNAPVANVTIVDTAVCEGAEVTVTAHLNQNVPEQINLEYQWYTKTASDTDYVLVPGATEMTYTTTIFETTTFKFDVVHTLSGCFDVDSATINVYPIPVVDRVVMSDTNVCEGSDIIVTAILDSTVIGVPGYPYFYEWRRNGELLEGNTATIHDQPMTADGTTQTYVYSVIAYQTPERLACYSELVNSAELTVFGNPRVAIFGDQHVCYTDTISLVANVDTFAYPVGDLHFQWYESGNMITNLNGDSAVLSYYAPAQDEPYRFTVQIERDNAEAGCRSYSNEYDVWVYNAPVANVTIVDTAVCEGAEVTVTAHLNQNVPEQINLEYQWYTKTASDTDYVLVPGATEMTYTTTIFETTTFKFDVVHTLSGCFDVDSATINVYPIPVVDRVVMSDTNVCEGSDIIVTAILDSTVIGVPGYPYFYEWRRNGELLEGNTATIHDQPMTADGTTQTYVYSVIAYQTPERLACYSELVNSAELTVFGNPRVAIFGDQHVCYTDTISLVANVDTFAYPVGDLHYIWYESGNMITNLNGDNAVLRYYAPAQDEPYRFTVQIERDNSEAACRSYSTEYDVWVYNAPVANVTIVDETVCEGAEVTVTAHLNQNVPEQTNLEYQWFTKTSSDTDYVLVPGATALTYTTIVNDTTEFMFRVVHTLSGCFDTDSKTINVNPIPVVNYVSMSDTNVCEGAQVTIYADVDTTKGVPGMPYFFEWRRNGELLAGNTQTIYDSPMTVDGNEQTFVYSVIAYQDPTRLACFSELVESATLNVFPNPRVAISGDQYVCETDSVFLYANVDTIGRPVGILHYTWYESGRLRDNMAYGLADSRYFSEYFYAQDEPYRFTVEVQRDDIAGGCRAYSEEFLVWVYKQPVVNITADETEICRGGEIVLRANLNNYEFNYANDAQYQWYTVDTVKDERHIGIDADGNYIDSTIVTVVHNPIPGATMLIYRATLDSSAVFGFTATHNLSGCSDYDEIAITVNDIPVIVSVENLSGQDTLCPGGRVELHATVEGGVPGGEVYTWYRNGVQMESTGENLIDYPLAVDNDITMYIYEVVVKQTAAGCESVIDSLSTDTIWVVPNPTIELSGDPIVCDTTDQNIVITANVVSYVDTTDYGYTYQWYENNAPIEGETGLVLSMHKPYRDYPYSFNFEVKNPYGCTVLSEPFLVYVNDNPIVHIAADDTLICENGTVTLTADMYDQNAENLVFVWYINGDSIPGAYNTTYTTTLTSTSTFTYKAFQRDSHCAAISNAVTVNVVPAPVVDSITVVSVDTAICEGHVVTLYANISGGDTTDTPVFTWYKDNEVVVGVTGDTFTDYPMSVDNEITTHVYNVTVAQASSACFSLYDVNDEVEISVRPNPRYTIYGDADVCEAATGNNITLYGITNDSIIANAADYTYTWYESGVVIDGQTTAILAINKPYRTEPYIFKLVVTDNQFGCTSETEDFLVFVSARPIVNVTSTEDTICTNGVVTLTANIYDQNAEYLTFQWYKTDTTAANMIAGANDPTYTTAVETTTDFVVVVSQLTTGCQTVANKIVKVNDIPVIVSVENLSGQDTLCPGGRVELHATINGGVAGGEVYTWYRNGVQLESTGENLIDYPMAEDNNVAQYIYEVTVRQTAAACQSVITPASTDTLWIVPNPTIELAGDPIVCDTTNLNVVITANVVSYVDTTDYGYTYQWYENNAPINGETGLTLSVHRAYRDYPYSFNFAVQNAYGCTVESEPFLVYVNDNPIVRISASETDICENGTVTLTANLYDLNADNLVYVWYKDNDSIPGAYNTTYTTTLDTTATFTFKAYQRDSHCAAISNELTINVAPIPVVDSITLLSEHDTICAGGRVELRANISGGVAGGEVYTWYRNGVELESTGNTVVDYPLTVDNTFATYVYEVVVRQTASACQSVITPASTHTILVAPNPTIELAGDAIVCEATGNNVTVNANVVYYVDTTNFGFTYQWYENNVAINGENGLVLSMNKPYRDYPYSFNFAVQNRFGCTVESEPFLVYVNDAPVVSIAADDTMICENGTVTLTANLYDLNADNMVYVWYKNGDSIPGAYNTTYTTSLDTTATFTFKAFQRNSHCEATSNPVTVTVVAAPSVDSITVVSNDVTICEGHVVELHANISGGDTNDEVTYTWYKDNEIVVGATGANFIDYPMSVDGDITTHIYNVTVAQTSEACYSLYDVNTEIAVSVRPNPVYNIYGDADVCEEDDTTIANINLVGITTDSVIGTNADYTFTWYESGVEIAGQTTATLAINRPYRHEPYLFKLIVTDNVYGCTFETSEFAVTVDQRPVVVIAVDMDSICEGGNVTLTSTLMNQTEEGIIYQWQQDVNGTWANIEGAIAPIYVTPALTQTTTYRLHVTNTINGCESNSINDITVTVKPTPVIDIINVTADVVCDGGEVTLTATGADQYTGLGDVQYQWYKNGQAIFGADQNVYTTSPLTVDGNMTTYTFGVQVTMSNSGCVSNIDTATVTVYANPTVNITYNNGLTLCEGGVTTLTANPHHAYFTDFTYQWFLHGQPIPGATDSTYVVENLSASQNAYDYTVEITVNNGTQNGCSAVADPVYVTIVNDPTATITVNEGVNAICEGGTVTFTVTPNGGVEDTYNPYTYAWYSNIAGNGVVLGTEASFTTSADDAANLYVYYVDVTSAYGCNIRVSDTLRIVEDPTVTIAVKMGEDSVVCDGGHTTLIATVEGGLGTATYQWYKNGFAIAGATGNELVTDALYVNETAAYTVSVAQSGIACTATSTQFNVAVFEAIEVALSASSEVNCVGGSVTLTATTTNGIPGDMLTYQWFRNGNPINGATGRQYVTDENLVAGHYEYQVEVSSTISGCHVAQSGTIGITVEAEPTVMISSDVIGNAICEGGNITLTANVIYATNATQHNNTYTYTWKWYEGTTLMSVQTTDPHYTLPATMAAGSYNFFVEISSNDGLGCDASSQSNLFNVVIKPVPTVILTANADESCQGGDVTFNAVVIPSNLSGIYYWTVNGGTPIVTSNASITVNNMTVGTNNVSVVFAPNDAQVACNSATTTITHVVNAIPVVTVAATDPSRLSMCVGGTITIAATATGTANSSDRYVWTVDGQTQTGNTGSTFTTQLNTPGIHTFSAMVERAMGCNSDFSTPIAVTVAEQPTAQLTQTAGFTEMCAGGEITLMAKVPNYATVNNGVTNNSVHGTYTYTWFRDNAEFLTTPNVTVDNAQVTETLNVPAAYTYSVTISASGYNCQAAHATLDHQIRVVPDPSWSVNQVNPTELCIGGIVTLNAEVTGGVENQQAGRIQWYKTFNGVESEVAGLGGQNTDVPEAAGVYTYAPKYIDYIGAGCNIADATPTQVTVNDLPTARFTAGHGSVICGHDYQSFATLEITLTGTAPFTFTIMNMTTGESQTIVTSLSVYTYNVNPAVTSIYRIISVSDANGCIGTMDNVSDAVVSVSDVQIAAETVVASCEDWIARIPLQVNASTSTTFTATLPDGSQQTGNIMFDAYTQQHYVEVQMPAVAGDYIVTIEVDGCSGEVLVRVPASDASMGVTSTLVDQRWDDVVVVNNNPDNNGGYKFSTYQWYKNGEPINGATGQYYQEVGGLEGFYSVELDGIRVSDGAQVHFITCEKYFSAGSSIRVYPVPANTTQEVTIELNMTEEELEGAILDIYDVRGAHVKSLNNLTPITKVGNFGAQGTYFGRIITGTNEIKTVKFIIVK